jgi:hypothetical protein
VSRKRDLDPYRRVRKPVPKPSRPIPDRRRQIREERDRREMEEEAGDDADRKE